MALEDKEILLPPATVGSANQIACLSLEGRLLVFTLDQLKHQPKGGRGLTLIDLEPKDALVSVAAFTQSIQVHGIGRSAKPREEVLRTAALAPYVGKRARKGKALELGYKPQRLIATP